MHLLLLLGTWITLTKGSPLLSNKTENGAAAQTSITGKTVTKPSDKTIQDKQQVYEEDKSIRDLYEEYYLWKFTELDPQRGAKMAKAIFQKLSNLFHVFFHLPCGGGAGQGPRPEEGDVHRP